MKNYFKKTFVSKEGMIHPVWGKLCKKQLPQKEKERIFNEIISKIKVFERKTLLP